MTEETKYLKSHPQEMLWLSLTEMCQRFGFWGVGNLLVLYLVQYFNFSAATASHIYGAFSCVALILPVAGGYIADRWNYRDPVRWGFILTGAGCYLLAFTSHLLLYPALLAIALGGSIFTPSIYTLLGKAYKDKHHLREIGFSIYYSAVNIGVFLAMIILGLLIQIHSWRMVFIVAGSVQILGYLAFQRAIRYFSKEKLTPQRLKTTYEKRALQPHEKDRMWVVFAFCLVSFIFWISYSQNGSSLILYAYKYLDRTIGSFVIPSPWFISSESLFLVLFVLPLTRFYMVLRRRKMEPSPPLKGVYGLVAMALCYLILILTSEGIPVGAKTADVNPTFMILSFGMMSFSELLMAPITLSVITNLTPKRYTALLVGSWYFCVGISYYIGGFLAALFTTMKVTLFFSIFAIGSIIGALLLLLFCQKLNKMRHLELFENQEDPSM